MSPMRSTLNRAALLVGACSVAAAARGLPRMAAVALGDCDGLPSDSSWATGLSLRQTWAGALRRKAHSLGTAAPAPSPAPPAESSLPKAFSANATTANASTSITETTSPCPCATTLATSSAPYGTTGTTSLLTLAPATTPSAEAAAAIKKIRQEAMLNCVVGDWSEWGVCRAIQGDASRAFLRTRTRQVTQPQQLDGSACPALFEAEECDRLNPLTWR
eukprot:CAMPEP_0170618094 /NCGR_PEP_ID=MMETSP0224-20130122/26774_1 /TAXON_ID=285029 /ORGANISM="Togula jolla, Strain CCCM 725" /LENGTH=217 /DNA_ID=CAMNT_0010944043 /DNA_START=56 /DNA_END=709 /DNA_ORIENTATION=-